MSKLLVLNPFTIDADVHTFAHGLACTDDSLTVQADGEQADINFIVKQFGLTASLPYGEAVPEYADYSDLPSDYHSAINFVRDADNLFMKYPADIRSKFNNDAGLFLNFITNPANRDEAISLGFIDAPVEQASADAAQAGAKLPAQGDA